MLIGIAFVKSFYGIDVCLHAGPNEQEKHHKVEKIEIAVTRVIEAGRLKPFLTSTNY